MRIENSSSEKQKHIRQRYRSDPFVAGHRRLIANLRYDLESLIDYQRRKELLAKLQRKRREVMHFLRRTGLELGKNFLANISHIREQISNDLNRDKS